MENKILIVKFGGGLTNSLLVFANQISKSNCLGLDIFIDGFRQQFDIDNSRTPIENIIDIERTNENLSRCGLKSKLVIVDKYDMDQVERLSGTPEEMKDKILKSEKKYFISSCIGVGCNYNLIGQFVFHQKFYDIANNYNVSKSICIHLRLERDMLHHIWRKQTTKNKYGGDFDKYNKSLIEKYEEIFHKYTDEDIFISSSLLKKSRKTEPNLNYMKSLMERGYRSSSEHFPYRELNGIVDMLICLESREFIGNKSSTFSILINNMRQKEGKISRLM